jgi:hypothetical protein
MVRKVPAYVLALSDHTSPTFGMNTAEHIQRLPCYYRPRRGGARETVVASNKRSFLCYYREGCVGAER